MGTKKEICLSMQLITLKEFLYIYIFLSRLIAFNINVRWLTIKMNDNDSRTHLNYYLCESLSYMLKYRIMNY